MVEERKYCSDVMKKHFNKELVMTKKGVVDFEDSTKCWICDDAYIDDGDVKVRDHCPITRKRRGSVYKDCNINVKLNHNISVVFNDLKHDSHLIIQKPGKFNFKINVIANGLEKYMSFKVNQKLARIDSFQFLSSSLDSLVKKFFEDDFKCFTQEFDGKVLDLVKQKGFYPCGYMSGFEKFKKQLPSKEKFYSSLVNKRNSDKD